MNISLVRPRYNTHLITPPLALGYLSSYLARGGEAIPEAWKFGREYLKSRGID